MSLSVSVHVKLPVEIAVKLRSRFEKLVAAHQREVIKAKNTNAGKERRASLLERGKRLSFNNVARVALIAGVDALSDEELLERIADEGVAVGRPRAHAA